MSGRLVDHISSDYFEASGALHKRNRVMVYVEGYDDIPFWKSLFDEFEDGDRVFEVSTPGRRDLAKGKKVVLQFAGQAGKNLILCVDSDFDYLFTDASPQSILVNRTAYVLQTYTYAIENYLCYPPSLHSVCARASKQDTHIFDFEEFMSEYSRTIYPIFVWYAYAAREDEPGLFTLSDFRNTVRIHFIQIEDNGASTLQWLTRNVERRIRTLESKHERWVPEVRKFEEYLREKGVKPEETHFYMQGHTLLDNVVLTLVTTVANRLRKMTVGQILGSSRKGLPLNNELSSYNNSITDVDELLRSNTGFRGCPLFRKLHGDMERILQK